jgi:hypothetical protein
LGTFSVRRALWRFDRHDWCGRWERIRPNVMIDGVDVRYLVALVVHD